MRKSVYEKNVTKLPMQNYVTRFVDEVSIIYYYTKYKAFYAIYELIQYQKMYRTRDLWVWFSQKERLKLNLI